MNYLFLSAFLVIIPCIGNNLGMLCGLFWIVPLMIRSTRKPWSFLQGFLWGVLVFGFYLSWLLKLLVDMHTGIQGYLVWLLTLIWFALSCAVWLRFTRYSWLFSSVLFFVFLTRWSLFLCGVLEGYPLANPLLLFARYQQSLWIVQKVGDVAAFVLFICFSWFCAQFYTTQKIRYAWLGLVCLFPFALGLFLYQEKNADTQGLVVVHPWWYGCKSAMFAGYRMLHDLRTISDQYPLAHAFVMPESTFCWDIKKYENFIALWSESVEGRPMMFGGHRSVSQDCSFCINTVFLIQNGVVQMYDKQHWVPFVERVPKVFDSVGLGRILIQDSVDVGNRFDDDVVLLHDTWYQIFICSELFFQAKQVKGYPVILLWNESWLMFDWVKRLAILFVAYFSVKYDVAVLYVSTQGRTNIR